MSEPHTCPGYLADIPEIQRALDDGGFWLGCEHPERKPDALMVTIEGCAGCAIAAEAARRGGAPYVEAGTLDEVLMWIGVQGSVS